MNTSKIKKEKNIVKYSEERAVLSRTRDVFGIFDCFIRHFLRLKHVLFCYSLPYSDVTLYIFAI